MNFLMRKNRKLGMFWWRSELGDGHEGTSGGTMNGDRASRRVSGPGSRVTASRGCLSSTNLYEELELNTVCKGQPKCPPKIVQATHQSQGLVAAKELVQGGAFFIMTLGSKSIFR